MQNSYFFMGLRSLKKIGECKDNFKLPSNFNSEEFRLVANGFFQAEGHISCRIRDKYFTPVFAVNQNLTPRLR